MSNAAIAMNMNDVSAQFAPVLESYGLIVKGPPIADGQKHKCATRDRPYQSNGAYVLHSDPPKGVIWNRAKSRDPIATWRPEGNAQHISEADCERRESNRREREIRVKTEHKDLDIDAIIKKSGLDQINDLTPWEETSAALRAFTKELTGFDDLDRRQARQEAISLLKLQKVDGAAGLIDAAIRSTSNTRRQSPRLSSTPNENEGWPNPVTTSELLVELTTTIRSYIILSEFEATAIALWVMASHVFGERWPWEYLPILSITSPEKRCGKSLLLDVLHALSARANVTSNISAAALFRLIDERHPVVLIDEYDSVNDEMKETLRNVLNSAFQRGRHAIRCVGQGADLSLQEFDVFGPVAVAGIGKLPGTVADRSIPISLKRKAPNERVARFDREARNRLGKLRQKALRWAEDIRDQLDSLDSGLAEGSLPASLSDRARDIWRPLLAIALDGGDKWFSSALGATVLSVDPDSANESARIDLLRAIRDLFAEQDTDRLSSAAIVEALTSDETGRWAEYSHGKSITARQVARLLAPFGVKPKTIRLSSDAGKKGYLLDDFGDACTRYLASETDLSVTPLQTQKTSEKQQTLSVTRGEHVTDRSVTDTRHVTDKNRQKQLTIDECYAVTDKTAQNTGGEKGATYDRSDDTENEPKNSSRAGTRKDDIESQKGDFV